MPLFRFHRGGLAESLQTTRIVKSVRDLRLAIEYSLDEWPTTNKEFNVEIFPYPSMHQCFDARIGWYTHMVTADIYQKGQMCPVGFMSEPFE